MVGQGPTFEDFMVQSCAQIYRHAGGNAAVLTRLLHAIETISGVTTSKPRREAMLGQVEAILEVVGRTIPAPRERARLEQIGNDLLGRLRRPDGDRVMTEEGAVMRA